MRLADIVGYVADAQAWCLHCIGVAHMPRVYIDDPAMSTCGKDGKDITPIFAGTEYTMQPCCARCSIDLPVLVLPLCKGCGLYHNGSRHPRMSMHRSAEARELARR